jgi:hypothetical protein
VCGDEQGARWERYEIPWFDVPLAFRAIMRPRSLRLRDRRATVEKHATRSLILFAAALLLGLNPGFFSESLFPASLGVLWGLVALRLAKKGDRQSTAVVGFILGGWVCFDWAMTILINAR